MLPSSPPGRNFFGCGSEFFREKCKIVVKQPDTLVIVLENLASLVQIMSGEPGSAIPEQKARPSWRPKNKELPEI